MSGRRLRRTASVLALAAVPGALCAAPAGAAEQQAYAAAFSYTTPAVVAAKGDTLRFTNLDAAAQHDLDSDQAGLFDSPLINAGQSTLVRGVERLQPGTYGFHCSIHSWMKGALTVNQSGGAPSGPSPGNPGAPGQGGGSGAGPDPMTLAVPAKVEPLEGGEWPVYGRDVRGHRNGVTSGPSYNEAIHLGPVWSFLSTDGDFTGTPVVARGRLVMGSSGGTIFALDAASGKLRWRRDLISEKAEGRARITGSAAISGTRVFVPVNAVGRPGIVVFDMRNGRQVWKQRVDSQRRCDLYGSPQVAAERVFVGTSRYFGEQLTGVDVSARGSVVALDARTGRIRWKTYTVPRRHDGGAVWSTPAVDLRRGVLYVGTGNAYHAPAASTTDSMLALSVRTGRIVGHFQATANDVWNGAEDSAESPDADFGASPNLFRLADGREVVGQGQKNGLYWVLDRRTMRPVWNVLTGPGSFTGGILGSTAYDGTRVYGPNSPSAQVWAATMDGRLAWTSSDGGSFRFGSMAVANGVVYGNDMNGFLTAREVTSGAVLAKLSLGAPSWAGVAVAGGSVFTATGTNGASGYIVAYRPRN